MRVGSPKEAYRKRREDEQHDFARQQAQANTTIARFNGLLVLATFCTIAVGVWQARISQRAAYAARDAADIAGRTLTEAQLSNSNQQLEFVETRADSQEAAVDSRKSADKTLQATIDNFRQEQRAWIGLSGFSIVPDTKTEGISTNEGISHMNRAVAFLLNTGRTPARKVWVIAGIGFMNPNHVLDQSDEMWIGRQISLIENGIMPPKSIWMGRPSFDIYYPTLGNVTIKKVDTGALPPGIPFQFKPVDNFLGGPFDVVVFGKITYRTVDKAVHTTKFCSYRSDKRDSILTVCPIYNDME